MNSTLTVLLSGVVGVEPRVLFLSTVATEDEILQPGFMNTIEHISGIQITPGDFILTLFENGTKREIFIADFAKGRVITLQGIAGDTNAPGGVTGGQNLGTGTGAFAGVSGNDLTFKSFKAGSNILLTPSGTEILITGLPSGITGGTNLGAGANVYAGVTGNDLSFKTLKPGSNITLTTSANEILIAGTGGSGGITDGTNLGTGDNIFAGVSGSDLTFKTLKAGSNITFTPSSDEILIAATGGSGSNFDYVDTWFVAINGNDLNDGKSVNTPKATLNGAQAAFTSLENVINILDSATYADPQFFHENGAGTTITVINAPAARFQAVNSGGIPLFNIQSGELYIYCRQIINNVSGSSAILQTGGVLSIHAHRVNSAGGFPMYSGSGGFAYFDVDFIGGIAEFSSLVRVTGRYISGFWTTNIGIDNGELRVNVADSDASVSGSGLLKGQLGDEFYGTVIP